MPGVPARPSLNSSGGGGAAGHRVSSPAISERPLLVAVGLTAADRIRLAAAVGFFARASDVGVSYGAGWRWLGALTAAIPQRLCDRRGSAGGCRSYRRGPALGDRFSPMSGTPSRWCWAMLVSLRLAWPGPPGHKFRCALLAVSRGLRLFSCWCTAIGRWWGCSGRWGRWAPWRPS